MKKFSFWYADKMYSTEANIQIYDDSEFNLQEAIAFVGFIGYTVKHNEFNDVWYDDVQKEWCGCIDVKGEYE